jgi:menaquinone-dependent protoporphyrinogen IX oxidase
MRALICYESIFGNTRQIAEAIGEGLRGGCDVEVVEVGQASHATDDVDLLVVGGPTHAWSMSRDATRRGAREQAVKSHKHPVSNGVGLREWLQALRPAPRGNMAAAFDTAPP